jgi:acetyl esterase/lipase
LLAPTNLDEANLDPRGGTVIVCPGGNYEFRVPGEGMPVAELLVAQGIRAFVLNYRLLPQHGLEDMVEDLAAAVGFVRKEHRGGPIAAMGFSAGGHLVAYLAVQERRKLQLDAQVLVYPCIDGSDWAHPEYCGFSDWKNSYPLAKKSMLAGREALLGGPGFAAPPTFLVASTRDEASPPQAHSDKYARALRKQGIECSYLRRDFGAHGFGLEGGWTKPCVKWLQEQGFGSRG